MITDTSWFRNPHYHRRATRRTRWTSIAWLVTEGLAVALATMAGLR